MSGVVCESLRSKGVDSICELADVIAQDALRRSGQSGVPVDLQAVADTLNVRVTCAPLPHDGALYPRPDGSYDAIVDSRAPQSRQRFSFAHELAHALVFEIVPNARVFSTRTLFTMPGMRAEEKLCDAIAARLLMPSGSLSALCDGRVVSTALVGQIAAVCQVSRAAAMLRLQEQFNACEGLIRIVREMTGSMRASFEVFPVTPRLGRRRGLNVRRLRNGKAPSGRCRWAIRDLNITKFLYVDEHPWRRLSDGRGELVATCSGDIEATPLSGFDHEMGGLLAPET